MLLIALGRGVQFLILFATLKVSTTLLPPAEMAKVYLISSIVAFYALLLLNPVGMFMNRRLHAWNSAGRVQHYYNYFWLYLIAVCGIAVASLDILIEMGWIGAHITTEWILLLVGGSLLFTTVNQVVIPGLNLLGYRGWFVVLTSATAATSLVVAIIVVIGFAPRAENWICGLLAGQLIIAAVGWKVFFSKLTLCDSLLRLTRRNISVLMGFAWPISIAVGLGWVQTQSYRFMMESSLGLHALGLFAAGYGISAAIIFASESVFTAYLQPIFYKHISSENGIEQSMAWSAYAGAIFPSLMLVGLFVLATAPELTRAMLGSLYWPSYQYIGWGVVAELARVASGVYGMVAHARMKTRLLLVPGLAGASLSIALIWWLMPMYGSNGVGAALALSSVTAFVLIYAFTRNEFATNFPRRMLLTSVFMGGVLILLAMILRWIMGGNGSFVITAALLFAVGLTFLLFQYILLRPLLRGSQA